MLDHQTSTDSSSVISSPASEFGVTLSATPGGQTIGQPGREAAHANLSARQAQALGLLTSGTSGQLGITSSASASLASSLASRLKLQLSMLGSTLFKLTWKEVATPSGRSVSLLRASVLRTSGKESTSWPTPTANDSLRVPDKDFTTKSITLNHAASWVTPSARDWKDTPGMSLTGTDPDGTMRQRLDQLPRQAAQMDIGKMPIGFHSATGKSARLNPALSRWLMGLPLSWDSCGVMAMQS